MNCRKVRQPLQTTLLCLLSAQGGAQTAQSNADGSSLIPMFERAANAPPSELTVIAILAEVVAANTP
jgi:hypothetical protein